MADLKISQLTGATTPLAGTEVLPIVQSSSTKKVAVNSLLSYATPVDNTVVRFNGTSGAVQNTNVVIDDNNNMGLAVTPSAWGSGEYRALQVGTGGWIAGRTQAGDEDKVVLGANAYNDGSAWKYIATDQASYYLQAGGAHYWYTAPSGTAGTSVTFTQRLDLSSAGNFTNNTGNFVLGTAAKGVDFTANTPAAGMTSQLLNWYEEGTWTPVLRFGGGSTGITYTTQQGRYTRVGRTVTIRFEITLSSKGSSTGEADITGLPFNAANLNAMSVYLYANFDATYRVGIAYINAGTINEIASYGTSFFTHAQFTDTSRFWGTCTYQV